MALIVLLAGGFLPPVDFFIVNVTLPSIRARLGAMVLSMRGLFRMVALDRSASRG